METQPDVKVIPDGDLVLTYERALSADQMEMLREYLPKALPGRRVLVLDGGARLTAVDQDAALARIEAKLDQLIEALADEDVQAPALTLDGHPAGAERDQRMPL
jgi:hypothetical protein